MNAQDYRLLFSCLKNTEKQFKAFILLFTLITSNVFAQVNLNCSSNYQISHTFSNGASWDMCWERQDREGIMYGDIHYTTPSGIARKVLNQISLAQIHVPYDDNGARYHDVSDYGLGTSNYLNNLQSADCPNGTRLQESGKNMVCKTIITDDISAFHNNSAVPTEILSVFSVSHVGAYNYIPEYRFYDNGMIETIIGATGQLQRYGNDTSKGWTVRTGSSPVGISHLHNYYWRLDFDLGNNSTDDIFEEIEFIADDASNSSFSKSVTAFTTETARSINPSTRRFWRVKDNTDINSDGLPISYDILALDTGHRDVGPSSEPWTHNDIYATKYRACERFISRNFSDPGGCSNNGDVTDFVNGESLANQDLVVWFGITFHHIPRDEDEPYMHAHWNHFRLMPRDWTAGSVNTSNFPPVVNTPNDQHSLLGSTASLQVVANDPNGDNLSYSATGLPSGLLMNASTGLISGTLNAALGTYSVSVTATDGEYQSTRNFDWYIGNDTDNDGIVSTLDNCPNVNNPDQLDSDADGLGDACDAGPGILWEDDFEAGNNWTVNPQGSDSATTGIWQVGNPEETDTGSFFNSGIIMQRGSASSGVNALITGLQAGSSVGSYDIDNGVTSIRSPAINLPASGDIEISLDHYFAHTTNSSSADYLRVDVVNSSNNVLSTVYNTVGSGQNRSENWQSLNGVSLNALGGQTVHILVSAADAASGSLVEAGIDNISILHTPQDADLDGVTDGNDNCPNTANNDQADNDADGIGNVCDSFPNDPDNDIDSDGIGADIDNCPTISNADQANADGDALGDVCDSFPNDADNDFDNDGISGHIDNCALVSNSDQANLDGDQFGDVCDPYPNDPANDIDGDGISGEVDNCPNDSNIDQSNTDSDAFGDVCDSFPNDPDNDIDGDTISGEIDNCPTIANTNQLDNDTDGIGDACDSDDDNDGLTDTEEQALGTDPMESDTDGDGINDGDEVANGTNPNGYDFSIPLPLFYIISLGCILLLITRFYSSKKK